MDSSKVLNMILQEFIRKKENHILLLQRIQDSFGYVPESAVFWFSERLDIPASRFYGIITFYPKFRLKPPGKNTLTVCCGAACHIKGGDKILSSAREALDIAENDDTSPNRAFTVQKATCIGACSIAPVVILNDQVYGTTSPGEVVKLVKGFEKEDEFIGFI